MRNLRVFTTRSKNCYTLDAEKGKLFLVRASFYYGNYDGKSSPPIFELHFDGNYWTNVATSVDKIVRHEAIFVAKQDTVSVCVAQIIVNMFPFISALELRSLPFSMYNHVDGNYALILRRRVAFGTKKIVRYPDDRYDRIWIPANNTAGFTEATTDALNITVTLDDDPPAAVLQNAFIASNTSSTILLGTNLPSSVEVPMYMNMYFSEVSQLSSTEERSFQFYINGVAVSDPIIPPYARVMERYLVNFSASSNVTFGLKATAKSTLPPLINALEVFTISDELTNGTSVDDVEGLAALQGEFEVLREWRGDPCLPWPYKWDWVNCSIDATPRVTGLYLDGFDLWGSLPDFSSMDALETIDLHNNSLSGPIPEFLGKFPNLKLLNLADNDFSSVPSSLSKNTMLTLIVTGNPDLCLAGNSCNTTADTDSDSGNSSDDSPTPSGGNKKKSNKLPIILGVTIPGAIIFLAVLGVLVVLHHQRKSAAIATTAGRAKVSINSANISPQGQGGAIHLQMVGNGGQALMNEFKVNIQEQTATEEIHHHHSLEGHSNT